MYCRLFLIQQIFIQSGMFPFVVVYLYIEFECAVSRF